jgi:hypothetical protein
MGNLDLISGGDAEERSSSVFTSPIWTTEVDLIRKICGRRPLRWLSATEPSGLVRGGPLAHT